MHIENRVEKPSVQVQIVTYNSMEHLMDCLESVVNQSYENLRIVVIDNGSSDECVSIASSYDSHVTLIQLSHNRGYSGAHNVGIAEGISHHVDFVLTLNPDVVLHPDYVSIAVTDLIENPQCGGLTGRLTRTALGDKPVILDSAGLEMGRFLHVQDKGAGQGNSPSFDDWSVVWGVCGAAAIYRTEMLQDVAIRGQIFDESFFIYKEDVDLAWRANRRGWYFVYQPTATASHGRSWVGGARMPATVVAHSFSNQIALIIRHAPTLNMLVIGSLIVETVRLVGMFIKRPRVALLACRYVVRRWTLNWETRHMLQQKDLMKERTLNDFCHPGYL